MNILHSIILGVVEGLTEFLPVSSTAHLIIVSKVLGLRQTEFVKLFEIFIQSGAMLAVVLIYFKEIIKNKDLMKKIIISFLPTAVIGFLLYKVIKNIFFETSSLIIGAMFVVGVIFIIIEYLVKTKKLKLFKTINNQQPASPAGGLTINNSLLIGLGQSLAVLPGVSRAGSVMVTMMLMGYKREDSAKYSFLLAVPTILSAGLYDLYKSREVLDQSVNYLPQLAIGFIVSFLTAYFVIKWFIGFLQKNSLVIFGIYRIILSLLLIQLFEK